MKPSPQDINELCQVLAHLDEGLHIYDLENPSDDRSLRLVGINSRAETMTGTLAKDYLGKLIDDAFPALRKRGIPQIYHQLAVARKMKDLGEIHYHDAKIDESWYSVRAFPLWERHLAVSFKNITELKHIQAREKEILRELLEAKERAEEAVRVKSSFLSILSHEIRTPLNGILGSLQLIEGNLNDRENRELMSAMTTSGEILIELVNNVLDLSRLEHQKVELVNDRFDLVSLLEGSIQGMRQGLHPGVTLSLQVSKDVPNHFCGDKVRIAQVVNNLLSNAVKFTEKGRVDLYVRCLDKNFQTLVIEVKDTGIGLSPAHIERIFTPFSQADENISVRFGGSGLGLSVSRSIAELMGGSLDAEGELGIGSTFRFCLPLEACTHWMESGGSKSCHNCEHNPRSPEHLPARLDKVEGWELLRLLIIEDNPINMKVMTKILGKMGFENLQCAEDGYKAKLLIESEGFDLILLDIQMPGRDGYEVIQDIRRSRGNATTPTIAVTANANAIGQSRNLYLELGFDDVVSKPISRTDLFKSLKSLLSIPKAASPSR